eukprot:TRINITY_DN1544_c0_g1_i2.p1 TRINITY_DN1544_c0_g1~~TRINITY_DN1544_c0_g1_i2.p1  ORF type:complete len:759 (+),score=198.17 TRINITY_DN1544_c0_g1_i2:71-2347(+)
MGKKGFVDPKVKALVAQFYEAQQNQPVTLDRVVEYLRTYQQYARQSADILKKMVAKALQQIKTQQKFAVRTTAEDNEQEESDDDELIGKDGTPVRVMETPQFNLLNASLMSAYKDQADEAKASVNTSNSATLDAAATAEPAQPDAEVLADGGPRTPSVPKPPAGSKAGAGRAEARSPVASVRAAEPATASGESDGGSVRKRPRSSADGPGARAGGVRAKRARLERSLGLSEPAPSSSSSGGIEPTELPNVGYSALGGIDAVLDEVRKLVEWPMMYPEVYAHLGTSASKGVLFHGPPGCGKTLLANCIAGELGRKIPGKSLTFYRVSAPELVSGMSGESESNIRNLFLEAKANEPCLVFIDEIDVICPKRESAQKEMERRIVAQLLTSFDDLADPNAPASRVMVIGATNRADSIDASLRRAGRFDREIALPVPHEQARAMILQVQAAKLRLRGDFDFTTIARKTPGFVGADLIALTREASSVAVQRAITALEAARPLPPAPLAADSLATPSSASAAPLDVIDLDAPTPPDTPASAAASDVEMAAGNRDERPLLSAEQLAELHITMDDFVQAIPKVQPSAKREGFATIPNVSWDDVGALHDIRHELGMFILEPIKHPDRFRRLGLDAPTGVLLYGPPGCGKTLLAKAIANDCGASFISVKGPELLNKFVGESERAVRKVFERAKVSRPCIIFFDELDALVPRRDDDGNAATKRVVNQLLTELDGLDDRRGVFIIAATNRPGCAFSLFLAICVYFAVRLSV